VFLYSVLGWDFTAVGGFMALWVIGYGLVQASAPRLLGRAHHGHGPTGATARALVFLLALVPAVMAAMLDGGWQPEPVVIIGLLVFGVVFAVNSAVHSYLILAFASHDSVSTNVGFYYMANAGGRLVGTVLSGWAYQRWGLEGCLWWSAGFLVMAGLLSLPLPGRKASDHEQKTA
jgi:predicted MFS family arabinose efflux permease